ncbi:hypothetical protein FI667_g4890, partial [Globisporangium splendens]
MVMDQQFSAWCSLALTMVMLMAPAVNAALRLGSTASPLLLGSPRRELKSASDRNGVGAPLVSSLAEPIEVPPVPSFAPSKVDAEPVSASATLSFQSSSTASIIYGAMEAVVCILVLIVIYAVCKKKCSPRKPKAETSSHTDFRSYHPSPFNSGHHSHEVSSRAATEVDDARLAIKVSSAYLSAFPALSFDDDDDELSTSYRTCSRVFSERLSSEYSWVMRSDRSTRTAQSDVVAEQTASKPMIHISEHDKQAFCRLSMAHEDTLSKYNEIEMSEISSIEERSTRSSQVFSTFIESERSSAVSWALGSSWSGSDVSSLESARATDVVFSEYSASSSRSIRDTDVFEEEEENSIGADAEKRATLSMDSERPAACDSILLFKPIKPRLLTLKLKKATAPKENAYEPQVFFC